MRVSTLQNVCALASNCFISVYVYTSIHLTILIKVILFSTGATAHIISMQLDAKVLKLCFFYRYLHFQHGVGVEFVRVLPETNPPVLSNIFCECDSKDDVVSAQKQRSNLQAFTNISSYQQKS